MSSPTPRRRLRLRSPPSRLASSSNSGPISGPRLGSLIPHGRRPSSPMHERRSVMETRRRVTVGPKDAYEEEQVIRTSRYHFRLPPDSRERRGRSRSRHSRPREGNDEGDDGGLFLMSGARGPGTGDDRHPSRGRRGRVVRPRRGGQEQERDDEARLPERSRVANEDELRNRVRRYNAADGEWYQEMRRYRTDGSEAHRDDMVYVVETVLVRKPDGR